MIRFTKAFLITLMLTTMMLFNNGCSGTPELSPEVCEIGSLVCEVSTQLCENLPVPQGVCSYLRLACINLDILCTAPVASVEYQTAKSSLQEINSQISAWVKAEKEKKLLKDSPQ